jgi:hypothetical protein
MYTALAMTLDTVYVCSVLSSSSRYGDLHSALFIAKEVIAAILRHQGLLVSKLGRKSLKTCDCASVKW